LAGEVSKSGRGNLRVQGDSKYVGGTPETAQFLYRLLPHATQAS
jgi:hypothetical protein